MSRPTPRRSFAACLLLLLTAAAGTVGAADADAPGRLEQARRDLVELRFEEALATVQAVLDAAGLGDDDRAEALVLRAQAHVALGDLDAAADDYREILALRPGFRPDPGLTPSKAMQRFDAARAKLVGDVRLALDPRDAELLVDGEPATPSGDGLLPLLAGSHRLSAAREGYDPLAESVDVVAGETVDLELRLVPNARTVVVRTVPADVAVELDGAVVGRTALPEGPVAGDDVGELVVENVPLGEHLFVLRRECFREERLRDVLSVDLLDRGPKTYQTVVLSPARGRLTVRGAPADAVVAVDGDRLGTTPIQDATVCPGERRVEVTRAGRLLWTSAESFADGRETVLEAAPRPNVALVGADAWPPDLQSFAAEFNAVTTLADAARGGLDDPATWDRLELPADTDLAVALVRATRPGAPDTRWLYSPILRRAERLEGATPPVRRPTWSATTWGLTVADSTIGGRALVVHVEPGGPAARAGLAAGDRIASLGGRQVSEAAEVRATLEAAAAGRPLEVEWLERGGERRSGSLSGAAGPRLVLSNRDGVEAAVHAAWAVVDAAVREGEAAAPALANLALLFERAGEPTLAAATWRRVRWGSRAGIGDGTTSYHLGAVLQRMGEDGAAVEHLRDAAASDAVTGTDDGPRVAPAARDRLADLGLAVSAR